MLFGIALVMFGLQSLPTCRPGQVLDVHRTKDYTLTVCGVGEVGLRGVEPPLGAAVCCATLGGANRELGGEVLGSKDVGPEALQFLSELLLGKRVTLVFDGFRIGDFGGRKYAYVYLADKTFVNAELIRRGYGYADRQGSHPMRDQFFAFEEAAHRAKVGVWNQ
jgi:endonuclease YncB( thermonuclease family)